MPKKQALRSLFLTYESSISALVFSPMSGGVKRLLSCVTNRPIDHSERKPPHPMGADFAAPQTREKLIGPSEYLEVVFMTEGTNR